jgi:hypothetical protein
MKRFVATTALTISLFASSFASAQDPDAQRSSDNRAAAETLFFTARGLMEAKRYAEACPKLAESYRLDAANGTLFNLAVCNQQIGKIASAWGEFKQGLVEATRANNEERVKLATDSIAAIEPDLPFLSIEVPPDARVPGLEVLRNGSPLNAAAWATELPVDPGVVEVTASAPGYTSQTKRITMAKRQHATVRIDKLLLAPVYTTPETGWTGRRKAGFIIALAGGLAGAGVGTAFGVVALNKKSASDDQCPVFDGERRCTLQGVSDMSNARTYAWIADVGFGVAIASLAVGGYLFFSGARHDTTTTGSTKEPWSFTANVGATGAQGFLTHAF